MLHINIYIIAILKRYTIHIIMKPEKYHIEIHNVMSLIGGRWIVLNLLQSVTGGG